MQINETKRFDVIVHFSKTLTVLSVLTIVVLALHSPTLAWLMGGERTVQVASAPATPVPAATPTPDVPAEDGGYLDTTAEGQDVLMLDYGTTPEDLWDALLAAGYVGTPDDGCECLYIPVGTEVTVPHGRYVATFDGFAQSSDTHPADHAAVQTVAYATSTPDPAAEAARLILARLNSGRPVFEDLTWRGAPKVVTDQNDALLAAFEHSSAQNLRAFLAQRAAQHPAQNAKVSAGERKAAKAILARMKSGRAIAEDWTWHGAPRVVGANNDALLDRFEHSGQHDARAWLAQVVKTGRA